MPRPAQCDDCGYEVLEQDTLSGAWTCTQCGCVQDGIAFGDYEFDEEAAERNVQQRVTTVHQANQRKVQSLQSQKFAEMTQEEREYHALGTQLEAEVGGQGVAQTGVAGLTAFEQKVEKKRMREGLNVTELMWGILVVQMHHLRKVGLFDEDDEKTLEWLWKHFRAYCLRKSPRSYKCWDNDVLLFAGQKIPGEPDWDRQVEDGKRFRLTRELDRLTREGEELVEQQRAAAAVSAKEEGPAPKRRRKRSDTAKNFAGGTVKGAGRGGRAAGASGAEGPPRPKAAAKKAAAKKTPQKVLSADPELAGDTSSSSSSESESSSSGVVVDSDNDNKRPGGRKFMKRKKFMEQFDLIENGFGRAEDARALDEELRRRYKAGEERQFVGCHWWWRVNLALIWLTKIVNRKPVTPHDVLVWVRKTYLPFYNLDKKLYEYPRLRFLLNWSAYGAQFSVQLRIWSRLTSGSFFEPVQCPDSFLISNTGLRLALVLDSKYRTMPPASKFNTLPAYPDPKLTMSNWQFPMDAFIRKYVDDAQLRFSKFYVGRGVRAENTFEVDRVIQPDIAANAVALWGALKQQIHDVLGKIRQRDELRKKQNQPPIKKMRATLDKNGCVAWFDFQNLPTEMFEVLFLEEAVHVEQSEQLNEQILPAKYDAAAVGAAMVLLSIRLFIREWDVQNQAANNRWIAHFLGSSATGSGTANLPARMRYLKWHRDTSLEMQVGHARCRRWHEFDAPLRWDEALSLPQPDNRIHDENPEKSSKEPTHNVGTSAETLHQTRKKRVLDMDDLMSRFQPNGWADLEPEDIRSMTSDERSALMAMIKETAIPSSESFVSMEDMHVQVGGLRRQELQRYHTTREGPVKAIRAKEAAQRAGCAIPAVDEEDPFNQSVVGGGAATATPVSLSTAGGMTSLATPNVFGVDDAGPSGLIGAAIREPDAAGEFQPSSRGPATETRRLVGALDEWRRSSLECFERSTKNWRSSQEWAKILDERNSMKSICRDVLRVPHSDFLPRPAEQDGPLDFVLIEDINPEKDPLPDWFVATITALAPKAGCNVYSLLHLYTELELMFIRSTRMQQAVGLEVALNFDTQKSGGHVPRPGVVLRQPPATAASRVVQFGGGRDHDWRGGGAPPVGSFTAEKAVMIKGGDGSDAEQERTGPLSADEQKTIVTRSDDRSMMDNTISEEEGDG